MRAYNTIGRARLDPQNPSAFAICDSCGFNYNLVALRAERQWYATEVRATGFRVCSKCEDVPQEQLRTITLPPDPMPVQNARPDTYPVLTDCFINDGGVLTLGLGVVYPRSPVGLRAGRVWSNGGAVAIVPGVIANVWAPPLFFYSVTPGGLLAIGGGNLPSTPGRPGSQILWNNGGEVAIS